MTRPSGRTASSRITRISASVLRPCCAARTRSAHRACRKGPNRLNPTRVIHALRPAHQPTGLRCVPCNSTPRPAPAEFPQRRALRRRPGRWTQGRDFGAVTACERAQCRRSAVRRCAITSAAALHHSATDSGPPPYSNFRIHPAVFFEMLVKQRSVRNAGHAVPAVRLIPSW